MVKAARLSCNGSHILFNLCLFKGAVDLKQQLFTASFCFVCCVQLYVCRLCINFRSCLNDRICSRHFIYGQPASLLDETNPYWLPTLNLGHSKEASDSRVRAAEMRWERAKVRESPKVTEYIGETSAENRVDLSYCRFFLSLPSLSSSFHQH